MILGPDGLPTSVEKLERERIERRTDEIILAAAKEELKWGVDDPRPRDDVMWKRAVRKQLWEELGVDLEEYT